jgi:hypothetical protein
VYPLAAFATLIPFPGILSMASTELLGKCTPCNNSVMEYIDVAWHVIMCLNVNSCSHGAKYYQNPILPRNYSPSTKQVVVKSKVALALEQSFSGVLSFVNTGAP